MSYPYGRPGGSGSGDSRGVGAPGGQRVPVPGSGGPGSGGRRSSVGVVVGCVVGLVVAACTSIVQGPKDKDGADTILVTYRIVNNTSKTQVVGMCVPRLEQKGSKFPRATFKSGEEPEGYDYNSPDEIKPGETLTVMGAYKYLYVGEPVTFRTWAHITEEDTSDDPWGVGQEDGEENDTLWVWQPY